MPAYCTLSPLRGLVGVVACRVAPGSIYWGLSTSAMRSLLAGLAVGLKNSASFRPLSQMPEPEELRPNPGGVGQSRG